MEHKKFNYNSDFMSRKQDEELEQLEERLTALYANATNDIKAELTDFMAKYETEYESKRQQVEAGSLSEDEFSAWNRTQILHQTSYSKAVETMTNTLVNTDVAAMAAVNGELPKVVAQSYDYITALGAKAAEGTGLTTETFQIYNADTIQALIKDNPDLMPEPRVDIPEDQRWNKDRINRELTQGIVKGESIPKIADRLAKVTTMDKNAAIRNARTAYTSAENLGRSQAADDLKAQGIPTEEVWSATYDSRTRDSHLLLDGTTRDASGYFGVGIINTPLRFPADPAGDPEEVYNCRCRLNIQLQGIDHSQDDDLYEKFMKENFPDDWQNLQENEPYQARQAEAAATKERQADLRAEMERMASAPVATSTPEELPKASELTPATGLSTYTREPVQGKDITEEWVRDRDKYEFEIDDAVARQGFNGLPQVVSEEEFNKAVEQSGFIAQRTYAAPDQETLDAYRNDLYNGDWYVNCETGGAQYGQGMYCAADYNGKLTEGIQNEMAHYQELGEQRYGRPTPEEDRPEKTLAALPDEIANKETTQELVQAIASGDDDRAFEVFKTIPEDERNQIYEAWHDSEHQHAVNYTETLTLTPDANIISYSEANEMFNEFKETHHYDYDGYMREAKQAVYQEMGLSMRERADYITMVNLYNGPSSSANTERREALEKKYGITADEINKKFNEKYKEIAKDDIKDLGSFCALKGYDAINAGGHGESGSYTVILNRSKVIFKGD